MDHDHCSPNPCENDAPCFNTQADYYCHCTEDWEGKNCSLPRLQCSSPPCEGTVNWYFTYRKNTFFECLIITDGLGKSQLISTNVSVSYIVIYFLKLLHSRSLSLVKDHWWKLFVNSRMLHGSSNSWILSIYERIYVYPLAMCSQHFYKLGTTNNKLNFMIYNIIGIMKSRKLWWAELIVQVGEKRNAYRNSGKTSGNVATWKTKELEG